MVNSNLKRAQHPFAVESEDFRPSDSEYKEHEIRQLSMWMDQMELLSAAVLASKGWKLFDGMESLFRKLIFRPRRSATAKNLENLTGRYEQWKAARRHSAMLETRDPMKRSNILHRTINQIPYTGDIDTPALGSLTREYEKLALQYAERNQNELVSVIMPAYNSGKSIERAISSALNQLYANFELIIVNDGSTDDTVKILSRYASNEKIVVQSIPHSGPAKARNCGLDIARGAYFAYLDADNEWYPEYLLMMVNTIKDTPGIDMAYCAEEVYQNEIFEKIRFKIFSRSFLENTNYIDINSVVHRRKLYDGNGGFDTQLNRLEDWDLMLRYTQSNYPVCVSCSLVKYHRSDHSRNSLKNLKRKKARLHYKQSMLRIQGKLGKNTVQLPGIDRLLPMRPSLYGNLKGITTDLKHLNTAVLVRYCGGLDHLKACLASIQKYTPKDACHAAIIGHFTTDAQRKYLLTLRPFWQVIEPDTKTCRSTLDELRLLFNDAFPVREGGVIVMNSNVVVTAGWLEALLQAKLDIPEADCIVPRLVLPPYAKGAREHVPLGNIEHETDVAVSVQTQNLKNIYPLSWRRGYMELSCTDFSCALIPRSFLVRMLKSDTCHTVQPVFCQGSDNEAGEKKNRFSKIVYTPHAKVYCLNNRFVDPPSRDPWCSWMAYAKGSIVFTWKNVLKRLLSY